jgi:hypothetical protein
MLSLDFKFAADSLLRFIDTFVGFISYQKKRGTQSS